MNDEERAHWDRFREALGRRDDLRRVGHAKSQNLEMSAYAVPTITAAQIADPDYGFEDAPFVVELRGATSEPARFQPALPFDDCWRVSRREDDGSLREVGAEMIGPAHRSPPEECAFDIPPDMMAQGFVHFSTMVAVFSAMLPEEERRPGHYVIDIAPLHCEVGDERVSLAPLQLELELIR